jgi:hypothetical protein
LTGVFSLLYQCEPYLTNARFYRDAKENFPKLVYRSFATGDERCDHGVPRALNPGHKVLQRDPAGSYDRVTELPSIRTLPPFVLQAHTLGFACEE